MDSELNKDIRATGLGQQNYAESVQQLLPFCNLGLYVRSNKQESDGYGKSQNSRFWSIKGHVQTAVPRC